MTGRGSAARWGVFAITFLGVAVAVVVVSAVGVTQVWGSIAAIGWGGFGVFCLATLATLPVLGGAWRTVAPPARGARFWVFVWARLLRDAAADVLPFSQVGGLIIGAREVTGRGLDGSATFASTILDLTTELGAQLLYTLLGVGTLLWRVAHSEGEGPAVWIAGFGLLIAVAAGAGFVAAQRHGVEAVRFLAGRWFPQAIAGAEAVQVEMKALYRRPRAIAGSVALHLAAWVASGLGAWIALRFMGVRIGAVEVLAIESLLYAVKSFAFVVPNAVGVQEGAYALIGPIFGLPAETALALSLIKRGRDLMLGAPVLLIWQAMEGGRLLRNAAGRGA